MDRAYIIHQRPFSDSRVILECFTLQQGVVHAVARRPGKRDRSQFELFCPLLVEFFGSSDLKTLQLCEPMSEARSALVGHSLFCALYVNELLQRLLKTGDTFPEIFHRYENTLVILRDAKGPLECERALRRIEFCALAELGFALDFSFCSVSGDLIKPDALYRYRQGEGFFLQPGAWNAPESSLIPGDHLLAMAHDDFSDPAVLKSAKRIARRALAPLLGPKPLKSRDLFS